MRQIAERMAARGHDVTVATSRHPRRKSKVVNGVKIRAFNAGGKMVYGLNGQIDEYRQFVRTFEPDAILIMAAQQWSFDALWPVLDDIKARKVFIPCGFSGLYEPERLKDVRVGNPADEKTTMGPVATAQQLSDVRAGLERLAKVYETAIGGPKPVEGQPKGWFVAPTLFVNRKPKPSPDDPVNAHEVFGPSATLMPYGSAAELAALVAAGGGGLVSSVYADDKQWLTEVVAAIAPFHGRVTISGEKVAGQTIPPGTVMPSLLHGGPGRAGGGGASAAPAGSRSTCSAPPCRGRGRSSRRSPG